MISAAPLSNFNLVPRPGKALNTQYFQGSLIGGTADDNVFLHMCFDILNGRHDGNRIFFDAYVNRLLCSSHDNIMNTLINIFKYYCDTVITKLQQQIANNTLTIDRFLFEYNKYTQNSYRLKQYLTRIDREYENTLDKKRNSVIQLIKNYVFLITVLRHKFVYNNDMHYIMNIMGSITTFNDRTFDQLSSLFRMKKFYASFGYYLRNNADIYTAEQLEFILPNAVDNTILESMMVAYDSKIRTLRNMEDLTRRNAEFDTLLSFINTFQDKSLVFMMYRAQLRDRLLTRATSVELERKLFEKFKVADFTDIQMYFMMQYMMYDSECDVSYNAQYRNMTVNPGPTSVFHGISFGQRHALNFHLMREYAWPDMVAKQDPEQYNAPREFGIYLTMYDSFIRSRFSGHRAIKYLFDQSTISVRVTFDRDYVIKMTLAQYIVFETINTVNHITPSELSKLTRIPMRVLGQILNSMIYRKLVVRDTTKAANDTSATITINTECTFLTPDIDIILNLREFQKPADKAGPKVSPTIIKASIMSILQDTPASITVIQSQLTNKLKTRIPDADLTKYLAEMTASHIIALDDTGNYSQNSTNDDDDI